MLGAATVVLLAALVGGFLWLRDAPVVAVEKVTVTGATGPQASAVRNALTQAAREMTTLHASADRLHAAVAGYPQVKRVIITTDFPHTARIRVIERPPVAALSVGGRRLAVAADGTILRGVISTEGLPAVRADALPGGSRVVGGDTADALALLAAAPAAMRRHVDRVFAGPLGLEADLENGPRVLLGNAARGRAKWIAAARVLGDEGAAGAGYVDVRLPERPVAGDVQPSTEG